MKQVAQKGLVAFLIIMVGFTGISRASDSMTIPKVETVTIKPGKIEKKIEGTGVLEPKEEDSLMVGEGLIIKNIFVTDGQRVGEGERLLELDPKAVQERIDSIKSELNKLKLRRQQLDLNKEFVTGQTPTEQIEEEIDRLKEDREREVLQDAKQLETLKGACAELEKKLEQAKLDLEKFIANNQESQLKIAEEKVKEATDYLSDQKYEQEKALIRAQKALDQARQNLYMTEGDVTHVLQVLENVQLDYDLTKSDWERNVKKAEDQLKAAREKVEAIKRGELDNTLLIAEEEKVRDAERALNDKKVQIEEHETQNEQKEVDYERRLQDKFKALEKAKQEEAANGEKDTQAAKRQDIEKMLMDIDISDKQKELSKFNGIAAQGGTLLAPSDGVVMEVKVEKGSKTTDLEVVSFVPDKTTYYVEVEVDQEEGKWVREGDEVQVELNAENKEVNGMVIERISYTEEGNKKLHINLNEGTPGMRATVTMTKSSDSYDMVIPSSSLRQTNGMYYVLVATTKQTTMGEQVVVERKDVVVLDKNQSQVAVEGPLELNDEIIATSSKPIEAGNRVRLMVKE